MPIPPLNTRPRAHPAGLPLEKLAASKTLDAGQKTSEMARQFEALLLRQILQAAQKPAFPSKFTAKGVTSGIYQDMMAAQLADTISSSRSLGLAQELEKQLAKPMPAAPKFPTQPDAAPARPLTKAPRP
jgi:Rod binding domain-containing protein